MASTALCLPHACKVHATVFASGASTSSPSSSSSCPTGSAFFRTSFSFSGHALETQLQERRWRKGPSPVGVRAEEVKEKTQSRGLSRETGGQWLSCTTRHIRIYAGYVDPETKVMDQSQLDKLTLMLDPDNEFVWPGDMVEKVFDKFRELVETYAGADLTEYTLRLIGSDLEHYIRKLLLAGELKYNLDCRVLNFSMGKPRIDPAELDDVEVEE